MENKRDRFEMQKLNTLLSWFNHMCYQDIDKQFKDCNDIEKLICNINRYYSKYKNTKILQADANKLDVDLIKVQKKFEEMITKKDENGELIYVGDFILCNDYSPQLLTITSLDYLVNVKKDLSLRLKFSHINFNALFTEIEEKDKDIFNSTMKIYSTLTRMMQC